MILGHSWVDTLHFHRCMMWVPRRKLQGFSTLDCGLKGWVVTYAARGDTKCQASMEFPLYSYMYEYRYLPGHASDIKQGEQIGRIRAFCREIEQQ